jgi:sodium-dependent dicarboxylate transporter 2/3/5
VGFAEWMVVGVPAMVVLLAVAWIVLVAIAFPVAEGSDGAADDSVSAALKALGPLSGPEKRVTAVAALVAVAWVTAPLLRDLWPPFPSDTGIALIGAVSLFVIPADWGRRTFLLDWAWATRAPWGILLLFGGGLSLARAVDATGLAAWIGSGLEGLSGLPPVALAGGVAVLVILLTELTSNTATAATFLPVAAPLSISTDLDPLLLTVSAAMAASCAFMLPVATPPNAIVYGSGHVSIAQMMRAGLLLNVASAAVITAVVATLVPLLRES